MEKNTQIKKNNRALHWFRRDLRISDNRALYEATTSHQSVISIFIFDTEILKKLKNKEDKRVQFIFDGVLKLKERLQKKGSDLLVLHGDPKNLVPQVAKKLKVQNIYCNEDYEPYAKKRDLHIAKLLHAANIGFFKFKDHVVFSGEEVLKSDGQPYRVFTPYKKQWLKRLNSSHLQTFTCKNRNLAPHSVFPNSIKLKLETIGFKKVRTIASGEAEAQKTFRSFKTKIKNYDTDRDLFAQQGTSFLSPYIRFGMISTRELVRHGLSQKTKGSQTWLSELIWREFYQMILDRFPHVVNHAFNEKYDKIKWPGSHTHFKKWVHGQTGYPIIDATMIHFAKTGKMHNRLRMIVASFLVKDLLVDWKKGEKYFASTLLDFDLAANNGGWQWCASTGCDAQPYFRIFNPITQSVKFDPEGTFIKKQIPALKNYTAKEIHFPATCPIERQEEVHCVIGKDYPSPIVNHNQQRLKAIRLFNDKRG